MNNNIEKPLKNKTDWTDIVLILSTLGFMLGGFFLVLFHRYTIGDIIFAFGFGISIGAGMMRQFMIRWINKSGIAKVSGHLGKEITEYKK